MPCSFTSTIIINCLPTSSMRKSPQRCHDSRNSSTVLWRFYNETSAKSITSNTMPISYALPLDTYHVSSTRLAVSSHPSISTTFSLLRQNSSSEAANIPYSKSPRCSTLRVNHSLDDTLRISQVTHLFNIKTWNKEKSLPKRETFLYIPYCKTLPIRILLESALNLCCRNWKEFVLTSLETLSTSLRRSNGNWSKIH